MTRWHIETLRLAVSLIALILAFFITCKMANDIEARIDAENYAMNSKNVINYKDAMGYNIDFEENDTKQKQTEYYNDFDQREEKTVTKPDEANFRVSVKSDENKAKLTTVTDPVITRKYCVNIANTLRGKIDVPFFLRASNIDSMYLKRILYSTATAGFAWKSVT